MYRLVSRGTIEEAILALHEEKRDLVAGVLDGAGAAAKLSNEELLALIRAGEAAPDVGVERGEEVEQADVGAEPAGGEEVVPAAETGPSTAAPAVTGGAGTPLPLVEEFRGWLEARNPGSATVRAYPRAVERFLRFAGRELGAGAAGADLPRLLALIGPYRAALESGSFPAPRSEPMVARSALGALQRFARERGAVGAG